MSFLEIYLPALAALLTAFGISELFHLGMSYYYSKQQEKGQKAFEEHLKSQGIDPTVFLRNMAQGGMEFPLGFPTASGENNMPKVSNDHGQYL